MIPENMVTVRSPLLVPMMTVAKVVTEHLLSFCMMAHLLHSPKLSLMGLTLALHALQHGYSVQDTTASISPSNAWAVMIHKSQGLTLDKVAIDVGKREFSSGLTFVACSRVWQIQDLLFIPSVSFQRLASLRNSQRLAERKAEDERLMHM